MVSVATLITTALIAGLVIEALVLYWARRSNVLAHVNERSSHVIPTPTMGGIAIVLVCSAYFVWLAQIDTPLGFYIGVALLAVGLVGLWDDLVPLPPWVRLLVQIGAASAALYVLEFDLSFVIAVVVVFVMVWFTNLYNFMDGIDGIAAMQAFLFCVCVLILAGPVPGWLGELLWVTSSATLAFLAFNWPPARIFMGDVGSGYLGLLIAVVVLALWQGNQLPLIACLVLLAGFWFDASYTLVVRLTSGQKITQAHRSHLYQRLAGRKGHLWTTCVFSLFQMIWLLPMAWLSLAFPAWEWLVLVLAVAPLAYACRHYQAGAADIENVGQG